MTDCLESWTTYASDYWLDQPIMTHRFFAARSRKSTQHLEESDPICFYRDRRDADSRGLFDSRRFSSPITLFHTGHRLTTLKYDGVVDECRLLGNSHQLRGKVFCLNLFEGNLVPTIEKDPRVVDDAVATLSGLPLTFPLIKQHETTESLYQ